MMRFDKTRRPAVVLLGIALVAGLLSMSGCSDSMTKSSSGSGDKGDDPALKASMKGAMEMIKAKAQGINGNPAASKGNRVAAKRRP
jgi:hypothetical protein